MTKDDILRMAEECGIPEFENNESQADDILRFAALVAAAERERIIAKNAPVIEQINGYVKALEEAVEAEREACAKVCDALAKATHPNEEQVGPGSCAAAIRARKD